jgi:glutamine cyclotransferase
MNGTSGFQEVGSSASCLTLYRFLHKQRHRLRVDAWDLRATHDHIALSTGISTNRDKTPKTFSVSRAITASGQVPICSQLLIALLTYKA